jgi:SET domain-containing protein
MGPQLPLYIKDIPGKGRAVYCSERIRPGEVFEVCPVIVVHPPFAKLLDNMPLQNYYFLWDDDAKAIALGYGSIYNHSFDANAQYQHDVEDLTITFFAIRSIEPHEEICINYNGDFDCKDPVPLFGEQDLVDFSS